ncbi:MAG TPA: hypothetical protein PKD52_01700 [Clostridiales bacterium]|nr:hypothetical protein [Clostridiales bacterium]
MVLGIDIDDVITDTSAALMAHAKIHEVEVCQKGEILDHLPQVMRGEIQSPRVKLYFERHMANVMAAALVKDGAKATLKRLKAKGHRLVYITARGDTKFPGSREKTMEFLKKEQLPWDKIVFDSFDKLKDCLEQQIELMVDDSVKNCEDLTKGGIHTVLFTSPVNIGIATDLDRVNDWDELERYIDRLAK